MNVIVKFFKGLIGKIHGSANLNDIESVKSQEYNKVLRKSLQLQSKSLSSKDAPSFGLGASFYDFYSQRKD